MAEKSTKSEKLQKIIIKTSLSQQRNLSESQSQSRKGSNRSLSHQNKHKVLKVSYKIPAHNMGSIYLTKFVQYVLGDDQRQTKNNFALNATAKLVEDFLEDTLKICSDDESKTEEEQVSITIKQLIQRTTSNQIMYNGLDIKPRILKQNQMAKIKSKAEQKRFLKLFTNVFSEKDNYKGHITGQREIKKENQEHQMIEISQMVNQRQKNAIFAGQVTKNYFSSSESIYFKLTESLIGQKKLDNDQKTSIQRILDLVRKILIIKEWEFETNNREALSSAETSKKLQSFGKKSERQLNFPNFEQREINYFICLKVKETILPKQLRSLFGEHQNFMKKFCLRQKVNLHFLCFSGKDQLDQIQDQFNVGFQGLSNKIDKMNNQMNEQAKLMEGQINNQMKQMLLMNEQMKLMKEQMVSMNSQLKNQMVSMNEQLKNQMVSMNEQLKIQMKKEMSVQIQKLISILTLLPKKQEQK